MDHNDDGVISRREWHADRATFDRMDAQPRRRGHLPRVPEPRCRRTRAAPASRSSTATATGDLARRSGRPTGRASRSSTATATASLTAYEYLDTRGLMERFSCSTTTGTAPWTAANGRGHAATFRLLDRNRDGRVTPRRIRGLKENEAYAHEDGDDDGGGGGARGRGPRRLRDGREDAAGQRRRRARGTEARRRARARSPPAVTRSSAPGTGTATGLRRGEYPGHPGNFRALDTDNDGALTRRVPAPRGGRRPRRRAPPDEFSAKDHDGNGTITRARVAGRRGVRPPGSQPQRRAEPRRVLHPAGARRRATTSSGASTPTTTAWSPAASGAAAVALRRPGRQPQRRDHARRVPRAARPRGSSRAGAAVPARFRCSLSTDGRTARAPRRPDRAPRPLHRRHDLPAREGDPPLRHDPARRRADPGRGLHPRAEVRAGVPCSPTPGCTSSTWASRPRRLPSGARSS